MKHLGRLWVGLVSATAAALVTSSVPHAQEGGRGLIPTEQPKGGWATSMEHKSAMVNPYRMVENWPRLAEKNIKPGAAIGIIPDGKGGVWLHHRSEPPILKIDSPRRMGSVETVTAISGLETAVRSVMIPKRRQRALSSTSSVQRANCY